MANIIVIGGGLAGLAATAALGQAGHQVQLLEARRFLGGRATSYEIEIGETAESDGGTAKGTATSPETIDNCQHILLRCCVNLLNFYERLGVTDRIEFHREFFFLEPGGRMSVMKAGWLPKPAHFAGSFLGLKFLNFSEKLAVMRAIQEVPAAMRRTDLDRITMADWLAEQNQPPRAVERFWRQVLVSAINEELDQMAAHHGLQVFQLGFLARKDSYEMGIPAVPLGELYSRETWSRIGNTEIVTGMPVEQVQIENGEVTGVTAKGGTFTADLYISALPFERITKVIPALEIDLAAFSHSPITGIHLWFDRPVTDLPHATLLDRTIQWMFNKSEGRHVQLVVSASRELLKMPRSEVLELAVKELAEFFPEVRDAKLVKAHVVKEVRATFSACPGLERHRPPAKTAIRNLLLAGDWTKSGWPATMEGAVRSGYLAAGAACEKLGNPKKFLIPDLA